MFPPELHVAEGVVARAVERLGGSQRLINRSRNIPHHNWCAARVIMRAHKLLSRVFYCLIYVLKCRHKSHHTCTIHTSHFIHVASHVCAESCIGFGPFVECCIEHAAPKDVTGVLVMLMLMLIADADANADADC
jgi:hypothetical protein